MFLRKGDHISCPRAPASLLIVTWTPPQVQVNSSVSATAEAEIPDSEDPTVQIEMPDANREEETEDEDLDRTVTERAPPVRSTPLAPPRIEVVQETPTVDRHNGVVELPSRENAEEYDNVSPHDDAPAPAPSTETVHGDVEETGAVEDEASDVEAETDDFKDETNKPIDVVPESSDDALPIQRTTRRPTVRIDKNPAKRTSPANDDSASPSVRSSKRQKVAPQDTDSGQQPAHKTGRPATEATQTRSQQSSQCSAVDNDEYDEYDGPKPQVAFSNSTIQANSTFVKFLKKHGKVADSVKNGCNILWYAPLLPHSPVYLTPTSVRDGPLAKTMKLLQAIALGIPIVTDKWLIESTQANRLLPLQPYIPHIPTQEKDLRFSLATIWAVPQASLLTGYTIAITPALRQTYKTVAELEGVCKAVGARRVAPTSGKKPDAETIVLAVDDKDPDVAALVDAGHPCFGKDFLTTSILRGKFDLESDEFRVRPRAGGRPKKKGRPSKG